MIPVFARQLRVSISKSTQAAAACALVFALAMSPVSAERSSSAAESLATTTPVKHLVTIMQSNHSFDSLFGAYPGADGIPDDVCMPVDPDYVAGQSDCIEPFVLSNNGADFDHSHDTFEHQYRDGQNDGFISAFRQRGEDGTLAMGHYTDADIPFSYNAADSYVLFDRFFTSASAGSVPNRMFWTTGTAGISDYDEHIPDDGWGDLPTIFDSLEDAGVSWKFYVENYDPTIDFRNRGEGATYAQVNWVPLLNYARFIDDPNLNDNIVDLDQYFIDAANNDLPAVSYVVTVGSSGHPPSSLQASERMLNRLVNSVMMSPAWDSSVIQWAFDDWGGWYDHVPPPQVDEFGYGFRTAAVLVSPFAKEGYVDSETHDFTSILRFIEDNWSIPPLSTRDRDAVSIATSLDFTQPARQAELMSMDRNPTSLVIPSRVAIRITYSVAIGFAGLAIVSAFVVGRKRGIEQ